HLPTVRDLRSLAIFEIAFLLAFSYSMTQSSHTGSPFYLPDSVLLCALLLSRPNVWWLYLLAPLPFRLLMSAPPTLPLWFLLVAFANDSLKALAAAYLIRRALPCRPIRFEALRHLWIYWLG